MRTVYSISGLGADERAFSLLDLSFCNPVFIKWVNPLENESIEAYALRLNEQIPDREPVIIGLSFGGMVAVEIAKRHPCKKLILLSSAKTQYEIPFYLRVMRYLPIHKLTGANFLRRANYAAYKLMGIHNRFDKVLFTKMLNEADDRFITWALNEIIHWKNKVVPENTIHIHGTKDILLPYRFVRPDYTIDEGEHLMLMNKPLEIAALLKHIIQENAGVKGVFAD